MLWYFVHNAAGELVSITSENPTTQTTICLDETSGDYGQQVPCPIPSDHGFVPVDLAEQPSGLDWDPATRSYVKYVAPEPTPAEQVASIDEQMAVLQAQRDAIAPKRGNEAEPVTA